MFSDHLRAIDEVPTKPLLLIAAGLVMACQLVAMFLVADGQVEKAHLREASQASAMAATVGCFESNHGVALRDCERAPTSAATQNDAESGKFDLQGSSLVALGK